MDNAKKLHELWTSPSRNDNQEEIKTLLKTINVDDYVFYLQEMVTVFEFKDEQISDITFLHALSSSNGNSSVFLGHSDQGLVVVKEHLHPDGVHILPGHCVVEIDTLVHLSTDETTKNNPLFCKCLGVRIAKHFTHIVFEYLPLSYQILMEDRRLPSCFLHQRIKELIEAVTTLHKSGRAHRDVKLRNIAFRNNGNLVLIDYDSAAKVDVDVRRCITSPICTVTHRSPEVLQVELKQRDTYDPFSLDIWSVGCCIIEMILGKPVFTRHDVKSPERMLLATQRLISEVQAGESSRMRRIKTRVDNDLFDTLQKMIVDESSRTMGAL